MVDECQEATNSLDVEAQDLNLMLRVDNMAIEEVISMTGNRTLREPLKELLGELKIRETKLYEILVKESHLI